MQVDVIVTATADETDSRFEGELTVSNAAFSFDLTFVVPIEQYTEALAGKTTDEFRKAIGIRILVAGQPIELTNEEWRLFYYLLMPSILNIHNSRVQLKRIGKPVGQIALAEGGPILLKPEATRLLARPKFQCQLMSAVSDPREKAH